MYLFAYVLKQKAIYMIVVFAFEIYRASYSFCTNVKTNVLFGAMGTLSEYIFFLCEIIKFRH